MNITTNISKNIAKRIGKSVTTVYALFLSLFSAYKTRVEADSGTIQSEANSKNIFQMLEDNDLYDNAKLLITGEGGIKTRTDGVNVYVPKAYDFADQEIFGDEKISTPIDIVNTWKKNAPANGSILSGSSFQINTGTYGIYNNNIVALNKRYKIEINIQGTQAFQLMMANVSISQVYYNSGSTNTSYNVTVTFSPTSTGQILIYCINSVTYPNIVTINSFSLVEVLNQPNDAYQTTEEDQLYLGGNIAPNEFQCFKNVTNETRTFDHPSIAVSGTYTIMEVLNDEDSGKTVVSFTEVTTGTYDSIAWTGKMYAYAIFDRALTAGEKSQLESDFLTLIPEIESVTIGTQEWATSNFEAVSTPMGNVIQEMQASSAVEKVSGWDFTGWVEAGDGNIIDSDSFSTGAGSGIGGVVKNSVFTVGKWYKLTISGTTTASEIECRVSDVGGSNHQANSIGVGFGTFYFKPTSTSLYIRQPDAGITDITTLSVQELGWADSQELYDGLISQGESVQTALEAAAFWRHPNNDTDLSALFGKIYNKYAAKLIQADIDTYNASNPDWGWHIASRSELSTLSSQGGNACKVSGTNYWATDNGTNSNGFTALGAGYINSSGVYANNKDSLYLLCEDADYVREIKDGDNTFDEVAITVEGGSIRLIKD